MKIFQLTLFFISLLISRISQSFSEIGKEKGAYLKIPYSRDLQYRLVNGLGYIENGWDDARISNLSAWAGYDGQRKKLPEQHLVDCGYGIELGDAQKYTKIGILDVDGYLATSTADHSSKASNNPKLYYPANLYEPIWLFDGSVNPNNFWGYYAFLVETKYKDYNKIWETWNESDYTTNHNNVGKWSSETPGPKDLSHWNGTIFEYIRLLRIIYEVE